MTPKQLARLRVILAHSLSSAGGYPTRSYEACDIPTRAEIDRLVRSIRKVFAAPSNLRGLSDLMEYGRENL